MGPMKIRPYMYILSGTMFGQINHDGFSGILSKKWVKNTLKRALKAQFGLVWFGNALVIFPDHS